MTKLLVLLFLVGLPAIAIGAIILRIRMKRVRAEGLAALLTAGHERLPHDCFRALGRVFRLQVDLNPLFSRDFGLRLSTFADTTLEFEIRAARNVPTKTPQKLAGDPFYRRFVLDTLAPEESVEHLLAVKETLARVFPSRWGAYSKYHCEVVLSANAATHESVELDLPALAALAAVPAARRPTGGTWTIREGWEPQLPAWHWRPDQRARLPEGVRRWCVSAWYDNAYLNLPLAKFLWSLAGLRVVTLSDLWFLERAFGRPVPVSGNLVELTPEMAVAADQWTDGEFFLGAVTDGDFAGAIKFNVHDRAIGARVYVRRLFDDEFSWFSGEYEILSAALTDREVRDAFGKAAEEAGAAVKEIERPFSFKLLKEDRLDLSF